jgi:hypothetical protein
MSWPPSTNSYFKIQTGGTQIRWGTDGLYGSYIVVSATPADEIETLYVENGTGLKAVRVMLFQGRRYNITVVDDHLISPPSFGTMITLLDPMNAGVGNSFIVIENSYNAARKEAGQRVILAEFVTLIEGGGTPPSVSS